MSTCVQINEYIVRFPGHGVLIQFPVSNTKFTGAPVCSLLFWWGYKLIVGTRLERIS